MVEPMAIYGESCGVRLINGRGKLFDAWLVYVKSDFRNSQLAFMESTKRRKRFDVWLVNLAAISSLMMRADVWDAAAYLCTATLAILAGGRKDKGNQAFLFLPGSEFMYLQAHDDQLVNALKREQIVTFLDSDGNFSPIVFTTKKKREDVRDIATYLPPAIVTRRCRDKINDDSQKISEDGHGHPITRIIPRKLTGYSYTANHGVPGISSVLIGQSSEPMEVDPCAENETQAYKLELMEVDPYAENDTQACKLERSQPLIDLCNMLKLPKSARNMVAQLVMDIGNQEHGVQFDSILERLPQRIPSSITFTQEDMVVASENDRPLFVTAEINNVSFALTLMDTGSNLNLMSALTFDKAKIPGWSLVLESGNIIGVSGMGTTRGHVTVNLQVGEIRSITHFHVMDTNMYPDLILGTPWINQHQGVVSTMHQCFKGIFEGREVVIRASENPFSG